MNEALASYPAVCGPPEVKAFAAAKGSGECISAAIDLAQ